MTDKQTRARLQTLARKRHAAMARADAATEELRTAALDACAYLPKREVARLTGVSRVTLDKWIDGNGM